jgi:hypothetical protein
MRTWDYLIVTASHQTQALAYQSHLRLRHELGLLPQVREFLVVPDWEGKRIGSGGSTLCCLARVLDRERERRGYGKPGGGSGGSEPCLARARDRERERRGDAGESGAIAGLLHPLNILIVHAGGDSRRLPAYGPCGKIFVPVPARGPGSLPPTLFDLLVPDLLALPEGIAGRGQVVVAAGDALVRFDAAGLRLDLPGITMLGGPADPAEASRHGVYCLGMDGALTLYLQKPTPAVQQAAGAMDASGKSALDLGVMSMDADAADALLGAFGGMFGEDGRFRFEDWARELMLRHGVDLYREICCAMGSASTAAHYLQSARSSGSTWSNDMLSGAYPRLRGIPAHVQLLAGCSFLHFGATRQLIESGLALAGESAGGTILAVNNALAAGGTLAGDAAGTTANGEVARGIAAGGAAAGDAVAGGTTTNGAAAGGIAAGGTAAGGAVAVDTAAGGTTNAGTVTGDAAAGGIAAGGAAAGGMATGGAAAGDAVAGGTTTNGAVAGGAAAGDTATGGAIAGSYSWVEGCHLSAGLELSGWNVVVGVDLAEPLALPREACLDVVRGEDRHGGAVWFVRCYGVGDAFKDSIRQGARFCGRPVLEWIAEVGASPQDIWPGEAELAGRSLWNARVFPAEPAAGGYRRWLWMYAPQTASAADKRAFLAADRYSAAEIALLADQAEFHLRRIGIWAGDARVRAIAESCFRAPAVTS